LNFGPDLIFKGTLRKDSSKTVRKKARAATVQKGCSLARKNLLFHKGLEFKTSGLSSSQRCQTARKATNRPEISPDRAGWGSQQRVRPAATHGEKTQGDKHTVKVSVGSVASEDSTPPMNGRKGPPPKNHSGGDVRDVDGLSGVRLSEEENLW